MSEHQIKHWDIAVLTVSDRVSRGQATDQSGPELISIIKNQLSILLEGNDHAPPKLNVVYKVVPDEVDQIQQMLKGWIAQQFRLIVTTGGTGFSPRDITPEAVEPLLEKRAPGIVVSMLKSSLDITPYAMLSRPVAGIAGISLIITLPGSVKGARENFASVMPCLPHALALLSSNLKASLPEAHQAKDYAKQPQQPEQPHQGHGHSHGHHHHHHTCGGSKDSERSSPYPMIDVDKAIAMILEQCGKKRQTIQLDIGQSLGMVVAEDISSVDPFPPFRASIKDGYAVRAKDGPGRNTVLGSSLAGGGDAHQLTEEGKSQAKSCVRITTGAMIPSGYDAVVQVEDTKVISKATDKDPEVIDIEVTVPEGLDIRPIGSDIKPGTLVLKRGEKIGAAEIGLLATLGQTVISVYKPPVITIISTGDELETYDTKQLKEGFIRDSNSLTLASIVKESSEHFGECGGKFVSMYGIVRDKVEPLQEALTKSAETSDVIITSGGVSMGELDLVKPLLEKMGTVHFGRVNMKPGKPLTFATITNASSGKKTLVFALPGNPVSTMVTYYLFVMPALRKLSGHISFNLPMVEAKLGDRVRMDPERPEYHRCLLSWDFKDHCFVSASTGAQASCRLLSMKKSNALLVLPQREGFLEKGTLLNAIVIGPLV